MSLCWLAPAQRPSLRELRIMLLHLRSSRDELEAAEFDRRWNQLLPRSAAAMATTLPSVIADSADDDEAEMNFSLAPSVLPKHADIPNAAILPMVHGLASPGIPAIVRPSSFDSEFSSELNASLLAQAGSRQASLRSLSTSPGNTPDDVTLDDSFTVMTPHFSMLSNSERPNAASAAGHKSGAAMSSAYEMVSYGKTGEVEVVAADNEIKARVEVSVSESIPDVPPSSESVSPLPSVVQENKDVKDSRVSGEEDWHCFTESSASTNVNDTADENLVGTDEDEVSASISDLTAQQDCGTDSAAEKYLSTDSNVGSNEQHDSRDGSFCMLKVSVSEDDSLTKSLDVDSPAKSTTSSADWCLVSNHTEHSRDEELDAVSQVTDPSLPGDCVLVETKRKVAEDEGQLEDVSSTSTDSADLQKIDASECHAALDVGKEHLADDVTDH